MGWWDLAKRVVGLETHDDARKKAQKRHEEIRRRFTETRREYCTTRVDQGLELSAQEAQGCEDLGVDVPFVKRPTSIAIEEDTGIDTGKALEYVGTGAAVVGAAVVVADYASRLLSGKPPARRRKRKKKKGKKRRR